MNAFVILLHVMDANGELRMRNGQWKQHLSVVYIDYTKEWLFHGITEPSPESSDQELWLLRLCMMTLALIINTEAVQILFSP